MKRILCCGLLQAVILLAGCCCIKGEKKMFTDPNDFCGSDIEKIQSAVDAAQEYVEVDEQPLEPVALIDAGGVKVDAETGEIKSQPEF